MMIFIHFVSRGQKYVKGGWVQLCMYAPPQIHRFHNLVCIESCSFVLESTFYSSSATDDWLSLLTTLCHQHTLFLLARASARKKSAKLASSFAAAPASAILARLLFGLSVYSWPSRWGQTRRCRLKLFSVDREPSSRESS